MTEYNRFSIQILGTVDATSTEELLKQINTALGGIPKFKIKAVSHDKQVDGFTGDDRVFGEDGKELARQSSNDNAQANNSEIEIVEVTNEPSATGGEDSLNK